MNNHNCEGSDECKEHGCQIDKTGFCKEHGVEIERRKGMAELTQNIPRLLTIVNRLIGWSSIITLILVGSFTWTFIVKNDLQEQIRIINSRNEQTAINVASIKTLMESFNQSQNRFIKITEKHNDRMIQFIQSYHGGKLPQNLKYHDVAPNLDLD